jgi:NADPH:quinone reductase-like Zn-dependent oxidoreductase
MAKVVRVHQHGGPDVLRLEELEVGRPRSGELRIRVEAIGLNRSEALFRQGNYPQRPSLPTLMGYEAAGVVEEVGADAGNFTVGERVCVMPTYRQGEYGVYAEQAIVPSRSVVPAPPGLSPVEASSIWMQYFTAFAIIEAGKLGVGDYVIITAASSSVGLAAIQWANWTGAVPIATTRRSDKSAALKTQGAKYVIATEESDLAAEVQRITAGQGAQVAFDPIGGPFVETLANALGLGGRLLIYGSLSGQPTTHPHWQSAFKELAVRTWVASSIWNKPDRYAHVRELILRGLAQGQLKPVVDKVFPLDEIAEAHRYLESNRQVGKVVVRP